MLTIHAQYLTATSVFTPANTASHFKRAENAKGSGSRIKRNLWHLCFTCVTAAPPAETSNVSNASSLTCALCSVAVGGRQHIH
jgi:hypothetical protein